MRARARTQTAHKPIPWEQQCKPQVKAS